MEEKPVLADDATERISQLLKLRLPWLIVGLAGGVITTLVIGEFEALLTKKVQLAFFVPVIVYLSDAVGTQTETIYVRNIAKKRTKFSTYLPKEFMIGLILGFLFGILTGAFAFLWLGNGEVALTVGLAMFFSITSAAMISLVIPTLLYKENTDPAVGAGPFTTVIQDFISILIYFLIASSIIFLS